MAAFPIPLIAALALALPLPALATECVPGPLRETGDLVHAKWTESEVVFVGTLRAIAPGADDNGIGSFEPERMFKGERAARVEARVPRSLVVSERYVVFGRSPSDTLRTALPCGGVSDLPVRMDDAKAGPILAALDGLPAPGSGGVLYLRVYPLERDLEGTPVFLEGPGGRRVVALDRHGTVRVRNLPEGEYRIEFPRFAGALQCRWSPRCAPLRVPDRGLVAAELQVLRPSRVSSWDVRPRTD